ncbi:MAG: RlpA-like double-psi beta-barrel-protein domain-containing protein-containing protein [Monoraphidium minutum]|nr:MAG: RlpA-like double-psi beta-barrel-protein domain-containing protein-containing protein [Monoraphidium minutum]
MGAARVGRAASLPLGAALALLIAALLFAAAPAAAKKQEYDWEWKSGARATYYGTDAWSIHKGSCGYGYIWKDEPLGWDVAAASDFMDGYESSCGTCVEVACEQSWIQDNYGQKLDRSWSCHDTQESVVVRITDTCPCTYAANQYSNKRWCCNDQTHFDMSVWAWEKLADKKWGVIGVKWRRVPCDYKPAKIAPVPAWPSPTAAEPWGSRPVRDWPEFAGEPDRTMVFDNGVAPYWWVEQWNAWVQPQSDSQNSGLRKGQGFCAKIYQQGGVRFKTNPGAFKGKYKLNYWMYVGVTGWEGTAAKVPDIWVRIGGSKGACGLVRVYDSSPNAFEPMCQYCADYYWRWTNYLPWFNGASTSQISNSPNDFKGCGGNGVGDLDYIEFTAPYNWGGDRWICMDGVELA